MRMFSKKFLGNIVMLVLVLVLLLLNYMLLHDEYSKLLIEGKVEYHNEVQLVECPIFYYTEISGYRTPYEESVPMTAVLEIRGGEELVYKVEKNIYQHTLSWLPEEFIGMEYAGAYAMLETDEYVSLRNDYRLAVQEADEFIPICVTVDMQTGEIVYLDDLVVVDEELAERILQEGFIRSDLMRDNPKDKYALTKEELEKYDVASILERLEMCSQPYDAEHYLDKPSFYLRHGRLYLCNVFSGEPDLYIELEQIEDKLKCEQVW